MEIFGADIQNHRLLAILLKREFTPGHPVKIDAFGFNKEIPTLTKIYHLDLINEPIPKHNLMNVYDK